MNGQPRAAALSGAGPLTFSRLKRASFTHSSIYVALLVSAFAAGKPEPLTFVLGLCFVGMEVKEFARMIGEGAGPGRSAFLSAFFTLVGTHGVHVTSGLIWMA